MNFFDELFAIIAKRSDSISVSAFITKHELLDVYEAPPFRRYVGSSTRGIDLLLDNDDLLDVQIFVRPTNTHAAFSDDLPFGIQADMGRAEIHALLGTPESEDSTGRKYSVLDGAAVLTVEFNKTDSVRYLSIKRRIH
ncbi:hypothetical protein [Cupriavidus pauculus]|uniref:Uncharacterized protein n=1 Tax=Cupriavidus pauculus TaxID=82633 RepID=A0A2N5C5G4_9BURK|nr:hypothetical protein [Cupriavidus pauculus]PLP97466.1 hypothetical protein CYJ10_26900 [Cupriavidus pauculus]